jgi:hypothetical protein
MSSSRSIEPLKALAARAEARAYLFRHGEFNNLDDALRPLFADAVRDKLVERYGEQFIKQLIEAPFVKSET